MSASMSNVVSDEGSDLVCGGDRRLLVDCSIGLESYRV